MYQNEWEACGIAPAGPRVLVKPDDFMESHQGAIVIPETVKNRSQYAQTTGYVVALGSTAYQHSDFGNGTLWCKPGDRVAFAKYGGIALKGRDGRQYRLLNDDDVVALIGEEVNFDEGSL